MKKKIIYILIFLVIIGLTSAADDSCQDEVKIQDIPCLAITPLLNCGENESNFTVDIIFVLDTTINETRNLTEVGDGTWSFNFNYTTLGDYNFILCDNTTATLTVISNFSPQDNFLWLYVFLAGGAIVLLIIWRKANEVMFAVLAGFLFTIAGISIIIFGFPNFNNIFLQKSIGIIITMVGAYFVLGPLIEFLEEKF